MPPLFEWNTNTQTGSFCAFVSSLSLYGHVAGRLAVALHMNSGQGGPALLDWMCGIVGLSCALTGAAGRVHYIDFYFFRTTFRVQHFEVCLANQFMN